MRLQKYLSILFLAALTSYANAQLIIDNSQTATDLVQNVLLGGGVQVSNITFNGTGGNAVYEQLAGFNSANANVGIANGVFMGSGGAQVAIGPNNSDMAEWPIASSNSDPDLQALANGEAIFDAAVLEFDFIPSGNQISFNFVFASEEYLEFVDQFNDVFGFFLSGPGISGNFTNGAANIALIPGTATPVSINTLNNFDYPQYYVDNGDGFSPPFNSDPYFVQFDGLTTSITANATVQCGQTYHIKLAVGDALDPYYDSGVFLQANAFSSPSMLVATTPDLNLPCAGTVDIGVQSVTGGIAPYSYEWSFGGSVVSTDQTITVDQGQNGNYTITVTDGCGGSTSEVVVVGPPLSPPLTLTVTPDLNLSCSGDAEISISNVAGGTAPFTYAWMYNGQTVATGTTYNVPNNAPGTYTMIVNDDCGGSEQTNVVVGAPVSPPILLTVTPDVELDCMGAATLDVLSISGGTPPFSYQWMLNGNVIANTQQIDVTASQPGTYTLFVSDDCGGEQQATVSVTVPPPTTLDLTITPDIFLPCHGIVAITVITVDGGIGPYTFEWLLNGNTVGTAQNLPVSLGDHGTYEVTVHDQCNSTGTATIVVSPPNVDAIEVVLPSELIVDCYGSDLLISAISITGGDGHYAYSWNDQSGTPVGNGPALIVPVTDDAIYTVHVSDDCGGSATSSIDVGAPEQLSVDLPHTVWACEGGSATLIADPTGGSGSGTYSYAWSPDDVSDQMLTVYPLADTSFTVTVTDGCGDVVSDIVLVRVEIPVVTIFEKNIAGDQFEFHAVCDPANATFFWEFSSGGSALGNPVVNTFADQDQYWATVIATTETGCTDVDSVVLTPAAQIHFPNAFTPNGDGINDGFGPVGYKLEDVVFTIFDRWGEAIFVSGASTASWNGRLQNGDAAPTGVYVYTFRAKGERLVDREGIGSVTLLGQDVAGR